MKEKKFEKVVEWEEEPNYGGIYLTVFAFIFFTTLLLIGFSSPEKIDINTITEGMIYVYFMTTFLIITGLLFIACLGRGRSVHWREIK